MQCTIACTQRINSAHHSQASDGGALDLTKVGHAESGLSSDQWLMSWA